MRFFTTSAANSWDTSSALVEVTTGASLGAAGIDGISGGLVGEGFGERDISRDVLIPCTSRAFRFPALVIASEPGCPDWGVW